MTTEKIYKQVKRRERNHNENLRYILLSLNMLVMDAPTCKKSLERENEVIKNSEHHNDTLMI